MIIQRFFRIALVGLSAICPGCASHFASQVDFNPTEPLRVAVLPFYQEIKGEKQSESFDSSIFVDNVPLVSSKPLESPSAYVKGLVLENLNRTGLDIVAPGYVYAQLGHHSYVINKKITTDRLLATKPQELGDLLSADALLYGEVTDWSRGYYGIETVNTVGVKLSLVRARDGKQLWSSTAKQSDARGITGIPTGFSSLVLEPIKGLDNEIIEKLASKVVKKIFEPLEVSRRAEFLNTAGPAIFGAVTTNGAISKEMPLSVLVLGTPGLSGHAAVGVDRIKIPLVENEPGHYVGRFIPLTPVSSPLAVAVTLRDKFGRNAEKQIPN